MQFGAPKRPGKTYGKSNRNVLVHNFYDSSVGENNPPDKSALNASPAPDLVVNGNEVSECRDNGIVQREIESATTAESLPKSYYTDRPISSELKRALIQDPSVFDMRSSDEDSSGDTSGSRSSKRPCVLKTSEKQHVMPEGPAQERQSRATHKDARKRLKPKMEVHIEIGNVPQTLEENLSTGLSKSSAGRLKKRSQVVSVQEKPAKSVPLPRTVKSTRNNLEFRSIKKVEMINLPEADAYDYPSDHSHCDARDVRSTPSKKQPSSPHIESDVSTPSNLGLTALKLEATALTPARLSPGLSSDGNPSKKRTRKRLIDRLDEPTKSADHVPEDLTSDAAEKNTKVLKPRSKISAGAAPKQQLQHSATAADKPQESQARVEQIARPKVTYASQRSHLSEMVNELDGPDALSRQKSVDEMLLMPTSQLSSQLELEEDSSDDQAASGRLKSIHELRQAGVNTRFDRDVDVLLEDIDHTNHSSKALRLQALMKLIFKLHESTFLRHLASSGRLQRLFSLADESMDLISATLLLNAFLSLAQSESTTLNTLKHIFKAATILAPEMLAESRSISKLAKDRKQNLSRAVANDIAEFESSIAVAAQIHLDSGSLCPDEIALSCLEYTLRRMIQLGNTSARISTAAYLKVLNLLEFQVEHLKANGPRSVSSQIIELALSLLELCSIMADDADLHVPSEQYQVLGDSLAELIQHTRELQDSIEKSVLRVVVSLSNNKPRMCELLGHSGINKATFGIINDNFLKLARQAEGEQELDQNKLDVVVLALGCLLNFAECDSDLRGRLARPQPGDEDYIKQLVTIFKSQVSKVDEAMTKEQSQISVAFGYLSMLLCTLSLHPIIKSHVTQLLTDRSFEELCTAAEKFFSHLQTLEHISDDDASMAGFTARFSAILDTIRASRM